MLSLVRQLGGLGKKLEGEKVYKKTRIREKPNLLTDEDISTYIFVSAGVKKGADSIFFASSLPNPPCRRRHRNY